MGARQGGSSISETADLLGFSHTTVSRVCKEWCEKQNASSEQQLCGNETLIKERGSEEKGQTGQS